MVTNKKLSFLNVKNSMNTLSEVRAFLSVLYQQNQDNNKLSNFIFCRKAERELVRVVDELGNVAWEYDDIHSNIPGTSNIFKLSQRASYAATDLNVSWHLVINGFGQGTKKFDKEGNQLIKFGRVIQFESDDNRSLDEKLNDWVTLGMPKPTIQVWTGNKSIHSYWVLDQDIPIELLHQIQVQLLRKGKHLGADGWDQLDTSWGSTATKTMRMPGFCHPKTGNQARIIELSSTPDYYSPEYLWGAIAPSGYELLGNWNKDTEAFDRWVSLEEYKEIAIQKQEKEEQERLQREENRKRFAEIALVDRPSQMASGEKLSLLDLISKSNLLIFNIGSIRGSKNVEGCRLANDLIGCENWALTRGVKLVATSEQLFLDYSRRSGLSDRESLSRYNSLVSTHKTPSNSKLNGLSLYEYLAQRDGVRVGITSSIQQKPSVLGWDLVKLASQLVEIAKMKDETFKNNLLKKWIEEDLSADTSTGWIGVGNLIQIKSDMIAGKINLISSPDKTVTDTGFFTSNYEYCHTDNFKKIAPLFSWYIESTEVARDLTKHLFLAGAGNKIFILDSEYRAWGAGYFFAKKDQQLKPDLHLNKRYLKDSDSPIVIPEGTKILALKSEMGTGKTTYLTDLIKESKLRPLAVYSRVTLTQDVADKFGIPFYKEVTGDAVKHNEYLSSGTALCINSLKTNGYINFNASDWGLPRGRDILVLDEIESTLETLCSSSTIKHNRGEIQTNFIQLIKNILHPDSKSILVLSDANLKQSTIDLIQSWAGYEAPQYVIQNDWKFEKGARVANFFKKVPDFLGQLTLHAKLENRLYITSDTREAKSISGVLATETIAAALEELEEIVLRIDQETQHTIDDPAYGLGSKARLIIEELKRRKAHLLTSPTLSAGVSFDASNGSDFSSVWGCFKGVINIESIQQQIERERGNIPRNLYVTDSGKPNGCTPLTSEASLKDDDALEQLLNTKGITSSLVELQAGYGFSEAEIISEKMLIDENIYLAVWRRKNAIESSFASRNLRVNLMAQLAERGYWVNEIESSEDLPTAKKTEGEEIDYSEVIGISKEAIAGIIASQKEDMFQQLGKQSLELFQAVAVKCREKKLEGIVTADSDIVNDEMVRRSDRTLAEHNAVTKYHYENWAKGVECTVENYEVWEKNKTVVETGFINYCNLNQNENARLKSIKEDSFQSASGKRSKKDAKSSLAKCKMLENVLKLAGFYTWASTAVIYSANDQEVLKINAALVEYTKEVKMVLGVTISPKADKVITNIGNLLRACGCNQEKAKQSAMDLEGKRTRYYNLKAADNIYSQFWDAWATRQAKEQTLSEIGSAKTTLQKNLERNAEKLAERLKVGI